MKFATIEQAISARFLEVFGEQVGMNKKYRFKRHFCKALKMLPQELTKIENGAIVQYRHIVALQATTGCNLNWIILGEGEKYNSRSNGVMTLEERVAKLEKALAKK